MYSRIVGHQAWQQLPYENQIRLYFKTFLPTGLCDSHFSNNYHWNVISRPIQEMICFFVLEKVTELEMWKKNRREVSKRSNGWK